MKQNPLSDAKFSIWSDFYVRFEAIFLCYLKRIFRFEAIWNEIRYLRAIWNEMFVPSEAKSVIWMKFWIWSDFVCDMKWNLLSEENFFYLKRSYNVNFSCDFLSEIRYLTRHFQFETIFRAICSNFFVRSESKSHANFPWDMKRHFISGIWSKYFVRYEAIFTFDLKRICCTIWSEICYLKRNVRFQAICSCDIKEYFDLKRFSVRYEATFSKSGIWCEYFVRYEAKTVWSELFDWKRIFRAIWSEFYCVIWSEICYLNRNFAF